MSGIRAARLRIVGDSGGLPAGALEAGETLVLHAPPAQAGELARGVLLDDWLDPPTRARIDSQAVDLLEAWTHRHRAALTVDGADLAWIHAGELFGEVFLRELRVVTGIRAVLAETGVRAVALERVDAALEGFLRAELPRSGAAVAASRDPAPLPVYPVVFATSIGRDSPLLGRVRRLLGVPGAARGHVLVKPYRHLDAIWERLGRAGRAPVLDPFDRPPRGPWETLRLAAAGGWVGHPGAHLRRRARALVGEALAELSADGDEPFDELLTRRAKALLAQRAPENVAAVAALRSALGRGRITAAVMPSDGSPAGRVVLTAAAENGVRSIHVQHGFFSDMWRTGEGAIAPFIDGLAADRAAVWSERQRELIAGQAGGQVTVTGNPGASAIARGTWLTRRPAGSGRAVLLVQPPVGPSASVDVRAPVVQTRMAIAGLSEAGFREVVLRPHGLDPCGYERRLAAESELPLSVARDGPIEAVLASADVCVGGISTGLLEAVAAGVPTVFLETLGRTWPSPLDGSSDFPIATSADELAERLESLSGTPGREVAMAALGAREDALERVLDQVIGD